MDNQYDRRRDMNTDRRRYDSAAYTDRGTARAGSSGSSAAYHRSPASARPSADRSRSSVSRQPSSGRYERTPAVRQPSSGAYGRPRTASRLPEENRQTAASERERVSRPARKRSAKKSSVPLLLFIVGIAVLAALIFALISVLSRGSAAEHSETRDGIAYLESLEAKNPATIDEALADIRKKRMEVERDLILQKLLSDENDVWSMFQDYVILGDSRAVGFYYYDFLEKSRVLADGGDTIRRVEEHLEEIKALNPSYIFLCYGLNDVSIGYWETPEEYTAEFIEVCASLKQAAPNARIIVSSILPARDPAFELSSKWREIPAYSDMLEDVCEENDILFVDNSQTCEDHADLWDIDGIHVRREFYSYWARNLIVAVIEDETYE